MRRDVLLTMLMPLGSPAWAGESPVTLRVLPPIASGLAAIPRVARPTDIAEAQINIAFDRLDHKVRKALEECRRLSRAPTAWDRTIDVPMRGPRFLAVVIQDDADCGGLHPNASTMAVVYDLRSGHPVDWTTLLPHQLMGTQRLETGQDGSRTVRLSSTRLRGLFLQFYDHGKEDAASDCKSVVMQTTSDSFEVSAWLDGKRGSLVLQTDLPHAVQACADAVFVPAAILRQQGAKPDLVDALARTQGTSNKSQTRQR